MPETTPPPRRKILGIPVHCVDYESALRHIVTLAGEGRPAAVSACNTHLVALGRRDPTFRRVLERFDLVVPDGFPLVWALNAKGAELADRVYGPYLMRNVLLHTPRPWKHFFFGGKQECLDQLEAAAHTLQPNIEIAGTYSPPFRPWTEQDLEDFAARIRESGADFIWVALGGERQERWIIDQLSRHQKGVFLAVGDAFELIAGRRAFAPLWMQRRGLTWLYRLVQEPSRLWSRYLRFNSLFVYYNLRDSLLGTPPRSVHQPASIAFLGSRGVPARYSGFEVVVEELGTRLAAKGHSVTVYNRFPSFQSPSSNYRGMRVITLPTIPSKSLDTIAHTFLSALHAIFHRYDLIYLCGVGNSLIGGLLRLCGMKVIINVDGADFRRAKWGSFARLWLHISERWATKMSHALIADNREIVTRYEKEYRTTPIYLSYGCIIRDQPVSCGELALWGLQPREYILFVSRLSPENEADLLLEAFARCPIDRKLVICGGANYEQAHFRKLQELADARVIFTGARYGDSYLELSQNALFFVMPASIEATRLVLLDQMGMGSAILYKECPATKEVVGAAAESFSTQNAVQALAEKIMLLSADPARCEELGREAQARARTLYDWNRVVAQYEGLLEELDLGTSAKQPSLLPG